MPNRNPGRVLLSVRIDATVARRLRQLVKNEAGSPHFLKLGTSVESAIESYLEAMESKLARKHDPRSPVSNNRL